MSAMPKTILIVEDNESIREAIETIFSFNGLNYVSSENCEQAIVRLLNDKIDLVLCDIRLPDTLGYAVISFMKTQENLKGIPFIFLSAFADKKDVERGLQLGASAFITKPFTNAKLLATILQYLGA